MARSSGPYLFSNVLRAIAILALLRGSLAGGMAAPPPARNLLIITIDTTRADHLSVYGGPAEVPGLERLFQEGARFDSAFTVAPVTLPSHVSLFTGLYPTRSGVTISGHAPCSAFVHR